MKLAMGVATITTPSIIPISVMLDAFVDVVGWSGGTVAGGEVGSGEAMGSGDGVGAVSGETIASEFGSDVDSKFPTVMFLTVSLLTVKLYS